MDKLVLKGLQFHAFHGVFEEEKKSGNEFEVDLIFHLDLHQSAVSDNLSETIDYSKVYELVATQMNGNSVDLIETLCLEIGKVLFKEFTPHSLEVSVRKLNPPLRGSVKFSEVTMRWAQVVIALGSNLNNPHQQLIEAKEFLESIGDSPIKASSIFISEPVGPSEEDFFNAIIALKTSLSPEGFFNLLKEQERKQGRPSRYPKWTARSLDLDIIAYDNLVLESDTLIIPHAEYTSRMFVLLPLREVFPDWMDIKSAQHIDDLIKNASQIRIEKSNLSW